MILRALRLGSAEPPWPLGEPTAGEVQRARAMADSGRAREFTLARLALRGLVADVLALPPQLILPAYECPDCGQGEHGSPGFALQGKGGHLDDGGPQRLPVAASMSRAGGWALFALEVLVDDGERLALGVDLAAVADFRRAVPWAAYSPAERRRLSHALDAPAEAARLWARKEALLKARGEGLRTDPAAVETLDNPSIADLSASELGLPAGVVAALAIVKPEPSSSPDDALGQGREFLAVEPAIQHACGVETRHVGADMVEHRDEVRR